MARLKFLVFALVALGLWGFHLTLIGPLALAGNAEQAQAAVAGAAAPIALALEARRSLTQAIALKLSTGAASWNAGPRPGAKPEAPTVDRFAAVRSAANELTPAELQPQLFIALVNETGALAARGTGEPATSLPEGLEAGPIVEAGAAGAVRAIEGADYFLLPLPLLVSDKNEVRALGNVLVGLPLLPEQAALDQTVKALGLSALAVSADGKALLSGGDKSTVDQVLAGIKPASVGALSTGPVRELGPLALPLLVEAPVHAFGARQAIAGTPFEVVAAASARPGVEALAGYQVFGLGGLGGLLLLALVMVIVMGSAEEGGAAMVLPPPLAVPPVPVRQEPTQKAPLALQEQEAPPEASPDDFDFPPSGTTGQQAAYQPPPPPPPSHPPPAPPVSGVSGLFDAEPESDPFAGGAPPPPPPPARAPPPVATSEAPAFQPSRGLTEEEEGGRTVAYPAFKPPPAAAPPAMAGPPMDPFAMAAAQGFDQDSPPHEDNPDATRVAAVPAELIKAARAGASGNTSERPAIKPPTASMPKVASMAPAAGGANDDERHFQDVFRDFVATREKCREPADGLTFDKFRAKLLKNKEQLVAKYQCRTVRFQVYVKDGKAALKATPVKD